MASSPAYAAHPDHTIEVAPHDGRVTIRFAGRIVADTDSALDLAEADYPSALYIPLADCRLDHFEPTAHTTHCPFKGDARYWTLSANGETVENAVWAYDDPFDEVAAIKDHVSFYADRVTIEI